MKCPSCGKKNNDNWPIKINSEAVYGGCQECWEAQCSEEWWKMIDDVIKEGVKNDGKM